MKKDKSKTLIPVYSKIDAYKLPEEFAMLQAQNMDKIGAMQDLIRGVKKLIEDNKNNKNVSDDVYTQVKQMLDEEDIVGNEKMYSTTVLKEKTGFLFIAISFVLSFLMFIWMMLVLFEKSIMVDIPFKVALNRFDLFYTAINYFVIIGINTLIAFGMGFFNRQTHFISKIQYLLNFVLLTMMLNTFYNSGIEFVFAFLVFYVLNLLLVVIKPKWKLSSAKLMLNKKAKERQEIKNKKIKGCYVEIDKSLKMRAFIVLGVVLVIIAVVLNSRELHFSNARDKSVDQIKIVDNGYRGGDDSLSITFSTSTYGDRLDDNDNEDEKKIVSTKSHGYRLWKDTHESRIITYVRYDDLFDVVKFVKRPSENEIYAYVKTDNGLEGYILVGYCNYPSNDIDSDNVSLSQCRGFRYSDAIEYLPKSE